MGQRLSPDPVASQLWEHLVSHRTLSFWALVFLSVKLWKSQQYHLELSPRWIERRHLKSLQRGDTLSGTLVIITVWSSFIVAVLLLLLRPESVLLHFPVEPVDSQLCPWSLWLGSHSPPEEPRTWQKSSVFSRDCLTWPGRNFPSGSEL